MQTEHNTPSHRKLPLISFIITCYNLPVALLQQCIDSIMALSLSSAEREIIVVDDGSEPSPLPQLASFAGSIVYVRQPNRGLSEARNTGIRISTGRYLQFVDGDDRLVRNSYEHCIDLVRYMNTDIVLFCLAEKPEELAVYDDTDTESGTDYMKNHNLQGSACGYVFRRAALGELQFTPGIYHEDEEFTPQLLLRCDTAIATNAKAYLYRHRPDSIMTTMSVRHRLKRLSDMLTVIGRLNTLADTLPTESRLSLLRRVHQLTMDYIYNVIRFTHSRHYLNRKLKVLHAKGLYPLPKRDYTKKYALFCRMANSDVGLTTLMQSIPLLKAEK